MCQVQHNKKQVPLSLLIKQPFFSIIFLRTNKKGSKRLHKMSKRKLVPEEEKQSVNKARTSLVSTPADGVGPNQILSRPAENEVGLSFMNNERG
jgi:hypothetical protein